MRTDAVQVIETIDASEEAARLGLRCHVALSSALVERLDRTLVLERIRDALVGTDSDPGTELLRAVALRGEHPRSLDPTGVSALRSVNWRGGELRRFLARARAGIGGVNERGDGLALVIRDVAVLCWLASWPIHGPRVRGPALFITTLDAGLELDVDGVLVSPL
jgi:hypothetical protein